MTDEPTCWDILLEQFLRNLHEAKPSDFEGARPKEKVAEDVAWALYGFPGGDGMQGYEALKSYLLRRADELCELQERGDASMDDVIDLMGDFPLAERLESKVFESPPERKQLTPEEYWKWRASVDNED